MQTVQSCQTPVSLKNVYVAQTQPAPNIHRINVTPAHAHAGPTLNVLERGYIAYPEPAYLVRIFSLTNDYKTSLNFKLDAKINVFGFILYKRP